MKQLLNILPAFLFALLLGCGEAARFPGKAPPQGEEVKDAERVGKEAQGAGDKDEAKPTPRRIIYTGLVDLIVDDFDESERQLRQLVEEQQGYVAESDIYNRPGLPRSGNWTVRVPTRNFAAFMQAIVKFGEVRKRTTNSQDITDVYYDRAARLKADEAEEKSLLALLEKTQGRVEDILKVREQVRTVRGHIEANKSQLQRWNKDVDLATVTVKLLDRRDYTPPLMPDFGSSVGGTFRGSIDALVAVGKTLVLVVVALAPWLAVLGILAIPVLLLRRRRRPVVAVAEESSSAPGPQASP
jgi:hypothetical protein